MNAPTAIDRHRAAFDASQQTADAAAAPPWLRRMRSLAFDRFAARGWPTLRDEDWKYTSVAGIADRDFAPPPTVAPALAPEQIAALALDRAAVLVFVDGRPAPGLWRLGALPPGARAGSLALAAGPDGDRIEPLLATDAESAAGGFAALNAASWSDGAWIDLAPGCVLDRPLQLLFVTTTAGVGVHLRNVVRAGAGARADIVEHHVGLTDAAYLCTTVTHVDLGPGAAVTHAKLQQEGARGFHIADVRAAQARESRYVSQSFALGAALARNDIATRFDAPRSEATLLGLYLARGRQHVDHHTRIDHARPECTSREFYKGVLDGASRAVFNGKVIVRADAQRTDADQSNRNLLLSDLAEIDTKPQLEIFADDVKCSHGATVGQLDPDQMFYLRSRGIDAAAARDLLTLAFAREVVDRVACVPLRDRLDRLLRRRLPLSPEVPR